MFQLCCLFNLIVNICHSSKIVIVQYLHSHRRFAPLRSVFVSQDAASRETKMGRRSTVTVLRVFGPCFFCFAFLISHSYCAYCPGADTVPDKEEEELFPLPDGPPDEVFPDPGLVGVVEVLPGWLAALVGVVLLPG